MKGMNNICSINQKWVREPSPDPCKGNDNKAKYKIYRNYFLKA